MYNRRVLVLMGVFALFVSAYCCAATAKVTPKTTPKAVSKDVAAVVNGEIITTKQLQDTLYKWYAPQGVQDLVLVKLVDREAKKAGVVVTDSQVKARIDELEKTASARGMTFSDQVKQSGKTLDYARAMIRTELEARAVLDKTTVVTPADLEGYVKIETILVRSNPAPAPGAKPANVTRSPAEADKAAKDQIEKIAKEIKGGLSFEDAAKKYSDDTTTKDKGGDLGWIGRGPMLQEYQKAAFTMKPGEVSDVIKAPYGYHLIKLVELGKDAKGADKAELESKIKQQRINLSSWIMKLQSDAKIVSDFYTPNRPRQTGSMNPMAPRSRVQRAPGTTMPSKVPTPPPAPPSGAHTTAQPAPAQSTPSH